MTVKNTAIADIEVNEYKIDFYKSDRTYPELKLVVPLKLAFFLKI